MKLNFISMHMLLYYNDTEAQITLTPTPVHSATSVLPQFLTDYV